MTIVGYILGLTRPVEYTVLKIANLSGGRGDRLFYKAYLSF